MWGTDFDHLPRTLDALLGRSERVPFYVAAHERMLYDTGVKWFGKAYPGGVVKHDQERGPPDEVDAGILVEDMGHELVGFLGGNPVDRNLGERQRVKRDFQS